MNINKVLKSPYHLCKALAKADYASWCDFKDIYLDGSNSPNEDNEIWRILFRMRELNEHPLFEEVHLITLFEMSLALLDSNTADNDAILILLSEKSIVD